MTTRMNAWKTQTDDIKQGVLAASALVLGEVSIRDGINYATNGRVGYAAIVIIAGIVFGGSGVDHICSTLSSRLKEQKRQ